MKTRLLVSIIGIVLIMVVLFCFFKYFTKTPMPKNITINFNKITKINIVNGSNGEFITISDKKNIEDISKYLSIIKLKKIIEGKSTGWNYRFLLYENDNELFDITFISDIKCTIGNEKYFVEKPIEIDTTIGSLYENALKTKQ